MPSSLTPRFKRARLAHHALRTLALTGLLTGCTGEIATPSNEQDTSPASAANDLPGTPAGSNDPGSLTPGVDPADPNAQPNDPASTPGDGTTTPGGNEPGGPPGEPSDPGNPPETPETPATPVAATGIALREIALYQGVKITIAQGANDVTDRKANVVAGRPALLRVFVDPDASFSQRTLVAHLTLQTPGAAPVELDAQLAVSGPSRDEASDSTFNFDLAGEQIGVDTEFSVSLLELPDAANVGASAAGINRVPETGVSSLGARSTGGAFRVVVVPVRYQADGSGRTPNLDASHVQDLRDHLFSLFPTSNVEVSVRAPMDFNGQVNADGGGWSELLDQCLSQRNQDGGDAKTYYYCMFDPAGDFGQYCGRGCVAGLGPVPPARDTFSRAAIGIGFGDGAETMAHELGHTLGLPHAPCGGVAGPDPEYPYAGGVIGAWGYDLLNDRLFAPDAHTDLMGYCNNAWISDYNYQLILQRFQSVLSAPQLRPQPVDLLSIIVDADQSLHAGHALTLSSQPQGEPVAVSFFDAENNLLTQASGIFVAVSHVNGGIAYVPTPPAGAARANIAGFGEVSL